MSDEKKPALLHDQLSTTERMLLNQIVDAPGFKVLVKIMDSACVQATQEVIKVDPTLTNYKKVLEVQQQRARFINEFCSEVRRSVNYHVSILKSAVTQEEEDAQAAVASTLGIHSATPKGGAIKNVFGIHPAKPQPKESDIAKAVLEAGGK